MKRVLLLLLCLSLLLTGCTSREAADEVLPTLPPAKALYPAPNGFDSMTRSETVALYLPALNGEKLLAQYVTIEHGAAVSAAEATVRALFAFQSNSDVQSLGGSIAVTLYGRNPVEVAGGVCTVNLASSVLGLEKEQLFTLCQSLASTLCQREDIRAVNVLVADQAIGMDIAGYLPCGAVTAHPGETLSILWEQLSSRATPLGSDTSATPLSTVATLYFPLADATGFTAETRNLTFYGQTPSQLASGLISALSSGAQVAEGVCAMPNLTSLLTSAPESTPLPDGSRMLTLYFTSDFDSRMGLAGVDTACMMGAIVYTLTTFIPAISCVRIVSGNTLITNSYSPKLGTMLYQEGQQKRLHYTVGLREHVQVCLQKDGKLTSVSRSVAASQAYSVDTILSLMMQGATSDEGSLGIAKVLPMGMGAEDVLGAAVKGDTLLLNLSDRFAQLMRAQTVDERLACYAVTDTLCERLGLRRVRFFFNGQATESLGGELYWSGEFLYNTSLKEK